MTVPVPAGNHPVSAIVTAPGRAIVAAQVSLASGRANMGNVTGTLPVANGGTGATNAEDARENLGIFPMTTAQVDAVMDDDEEVVSDNVVNGTVFTYIWGKVKAWAAAAFAPLSHTHTQSQISDMPISVANGGTGSTTASDARTSLGVTPANIGAAPATHDHSGQAITPASVAATGAVSGSSVSDSVGSLASLRESVSLPVTYTAQSGTTVHTLSAMRYGKVIYIRLMFSTSVNGNTTPILTFEGIPAPSSDIYVVGGNGTESRSMLLEPNRILKTVGNQFTAINYCCTSIVYIV